MEKKIKNIRIIINPAVGESILRYRRTYRMNWLLLDKLLVIIYDIICEKNSFINTHLDSRIHTYHCLILRDAIMHCPSLSV